MSATSLLQAAIDALKKQVADLAARLTKAEKMITSMQQRIAQFSIQQPAPVPVAGNDPCAGVTITDSLSHPPPTSGAQDYNSMARPALGASYQDSVFCKTVRRLSDVGFHNDNYSFHYINADGTLSFYEFDFSFMSIISTVDGSTVYTGQPEGLNGSEVRWDMLDPDKYYYLSGASLVRRNLAAQTNTTMKTFPATLQKTGGSENWQTANGRYFMVVYSNLAHIWDSQTDTIFTGSTALLDVNGWITITPSGNHLVTAAGPTAPPQQEHYAYPVNLGAQSIGATPVQMWGLCGDHGVVVSASDGKDYAVFFDCYNQKAVYRCDCTVDVAGMTPAQQEAAQFQLLSLNFADTGHFSAVSVGTYQDWVFYAPAASDDNFNAAPSPWRAYKQEILAINVLTGALRRLCHHRSRQCQSSYYYNPRVSCSATGNRVLFASNFNVSSPADYSDFYIIDNPLSS